MRELLSLPSGLRALIDLLANVLGVIGAVLAAVLGAVLHWPLGGLELVIGYGIPFLTIAGGARLAWAAYMLFTAVVFTIIARISE
jgi:hypothetical protein